MPQELEFDRVLKFYNREDQSFREDDRSTIKVEIDDDDDDATNVEQSLTIMLRPILKAFDDREVPLIKISIKAAGPFPNAQFLTELDLDFQAAKVEFRIKTLNIPCSFSGIYRKLQDLCELRFLHLRYVALTIDDEHVLREIMEEQMLSVLFLGVVKMDGTIFLRALESSTSLQTLALIWLHLDDPTAGVEGPHNFPVIPFCERLHLFKSIHNLVLLPFVSTPQLWSALNAGLQQSNTLEDVMISGEGGCVLNDNILKGLCNNINRQVMKRLRINNACMGEQGMEVLCDMLLNSSVEFLDLSSSTISHTCVLCFAEKLPQMNNLHVIDFRDIKDEKHKSWARPIMESLLDGMEQNSCLREVILSITPETLDLEARKDFLLQRNQSRKMILEERTGLWPEILTRLDKRGGKSLTYYLLRERLDILFKATCKKRVAELCDGERRPLKKSKSQR
mmetsp:Transcript_2115/g.3036  ORF Transcript_2115/g.3036 Transcript_2115/m.3036 type:complete len:451 (-) Transcript_2115:111-1463(-)